MDRADVPEWEQRTGRAFAGESFLIEYAVPSNADCANCRTIFRNDRARAEEVANERGTKVEVRLVTVWRAT